MSASGLVVDNVWKNFDSRPVLRGLSMTVPAHSATVLIGASGSGKSTLLRCLNALLQIDAGSIWLDGTLEVSSLSADADFIRRKVGIVFQNFNLFPHMTVLDNVMLAPVKVVGQSKTQAKHDAMVLLERFGLADKAQAYPDRLSGGQSQRVAIVRALAVQPEVMLFDEITSALDPLLVDEVLDVVRELKSTGLTIVMATHEMQFAAEVADQVCFLHEGVVWESGTAQALFTSPQREKTQQFLRRMHR
jgi:polar amino acid transport system ATP-binding protein